MGSGRHIDVSEIEALTTAAEDLKESVASNFANLKFEDETEDRIRARTQAEWQVLSHP